MALAWTVRRTPGVVMSLLRHLCRHSDPRVVGGALASQASTRREHVVEARCQSACGQRSGGRDLRVAFHACRRRWYASALNRGGRALESDHAELLHGAVWTLAVSAAAPTHQLFEGVMFPGTIVLLLAAAGCLGGGSGHGDQRAIPRLVWPCVPLMVADSASLPIPLESIPAVPRGYSWLAKQPAAPMLEWPIDIGTDCSTDTAVTTRKATLSCWNTAAQGLS